VSTWTPDQQRTTPQGWRAAQRSGNAAGASQPLRHRVLAITSRTRCSASSALLRRAGTHTFASTCPRISSAPRRKERRAAQRPGNAAGASQPLRLRVLAIMSRSRCSASSRCSAEPGPILSRQHGPRISSAPRRKGGALRSIRGTPLALRSHCATASWPSCPGRGAALLRDAPQSRDPYFRVDMDLGSAAHHGARAARCAASGERRWRYAATAPPRPGHRVPDAVQRFFALLRRAGTHTFASTWTPDQQRTTPQGRRVAQRPGNAAGVTPPPPSCSAGARRDHRPQRDPPMSRCRRGCPARPRRSCAGCGA
jgi:hypothetical protein